ncbi:MAG TPA: hypothetical protein VJ962_10185 [Clostridia bacterium]|nr:hypothetical protein [Clostridia bacterium]
MSYWKFEKNEYYLGDKYGSISNAILLILHEIESAYEKEIVLN